MNRHTALARSIIAAFGLTCVALVPSCNGIDLREPAVAVTTADLTVSTMDHTYVDDTYIRTGTATQSNSNFGGSADLLVTAPAGSSEILMRWDPAQIRTRVGSSYFLSARIRIWTNVGNAKLTAWTVAPGSAEWTEGNSVAGATWNCAIDNIMNSVADCPTDPGIWSVPRYGTELGEAGLITNGPGWVELDVSPEVLNIVNGTGPHAGFVLRSSVVNAETTFYSSTNVDIPHRPELVLTYVTGNYTPPEPTAAPALDRSSPTHTYDAMSFLLDPTLGLQWGFTPGIFERTSAGVIRGAVYDRNTGNPLPGVEVSVLGHPEYGRTRTRAVTGRFELMVRGGETLTLQYSRGPTDTTGVAGAGYVTSQRQVVVPWNGWVAAPDVAMTPRTAILCATAPGGGTGTTGGMVSIPSACTGYGSAGTCNAAVGCAWNGTACTPGDARGANRILRMYVPAGSRVRYDSGSTANTFQLCMTEVTIDPFGTALDSTTAMPADLPSTSSYTFAVEAEARTTGGAVMSRPEFETFGGVDRDFFLYVRSDGFLNFQEGSLAAPTVAPSGTYDVERGGWTAENNGAVIEVSSAASDCVLPVGAVTGPELTAICSDHSATGMPAGRYLRAPMRHFSLEDINWLVNRIAEFARNLFNDGSGGAACSNTGAHSIVYCENQALGEAFPVVGTPYNLMYLSDRHEGRREDYRVSVVPVLNGTPAPSPPIDANGVTMELWVAGDRVAQLANQPTTAGAAYELTWDGMDAYNRELVGPQRGYLRIGYRYTRSYVVPPAGSASFAGVPDGTAVDITPADSETLTTWFTYPVTLGGIDDLDSGLGGLGIDAHHFYDPATGTLFMGDGQRRTAESVGALMDPGFPATTPFAGVGVVGDLRALTVGPDGTVYYYDGTAGRIRLRRATDPSPVDLGTDTYAEIEGLSVGRWTDPATGIGTNVLWAVDRAAQVMYRVSLPSNPATATRAVVVGSGSYGIEFPEVAIGSPRSLVNPGTGLPDPGQVLLAAPTDVVAAPDGAVYIADSDNRRVLRYRSQSAGPGVVRDTIELIRDVNTTPSLATGLGHPTALALGPDGTLYYNINQGIRGYTGTADTIVVGGSTAPASAANLGEGVSARCASASDTTCVHMMSGATEISSIDVGPDGALCFGIVGIITGSNQTRERVRCVRDGRVYTLAGPRWVGAASSFDPLVAVGEVWDTTSSETPATRTLIGQLGDIAMSPDGRLFFVDLNASVGGVNGRVRFTAPTLDGSLLANHLIASPDGAMYYEFDGAGRHLRTVDAITNTNLISFTYDATPGTTLGRLEGITDAENQFIDVIWDSSPARIRLVAPGALTTTIALPAVGSYATSVTTPALDVWSFTFLSTHPGLMSTMTDARGNAHTFTWDTAPATNTGRLRFDNDSADSSAGVDATIELPIVAPVCEDTFCEVGEDTASCGADCPAGARTGWTTSIFRRETEPTATLTDAARDTSYRTRRSGTGVLERAITHGAAGAMSILRTEAFADGRGMTTTLLHNTTTLEANATPQGSITVHTAPDPRPTFSMDAPYAARTLIDRPTGADTTITRTRTFTSMTSTLTDNVTVPSPTGAGTQTWLRTESPTTIVIDPPSSDVNRVTTIYTDSRHRVTRVDLPGQYPVCITYPSSTATRPWVIYQGLPSGTPPNTTCNPSATPRREVRLTYDDTDGLSPFRRWLTVRRDGWGTTVLDTTYTYEGSGTRPMLDTIRYPGTATAANPVHDAHGNLTSFNLPTGGTHTFGWTNRNFLSSYMAPLGADILSTTYHRNRIPDVRTYAGSRTENVNLDSPTAYVSGITRSDGTLPNDVTYARDLSGRPTLITSSYSGSASLDWDGMVVASSRLLPSGALGVSGRYTPTVPAHMLLGSERVCFDGGATSCGSSSSGGMLLSRTYDADGLLTNVSGTGGSMGYAYVFSSSTGTTVTSTATAGAITATTTTAISRNAELTSSSTTLSSPSHTPYAEEVCARDNLGRVLRRAERIRSTATGTTTVFRWYRYTYETHGYLSREERWTTGATGMCPAGGANFTGTPQLDSGTMTYNDRGNRTDGIYAGAVWTNEDQFIGSSAFAYDALGALSSIGSLSLGTSYDLTGYLRTASNIFQARSYDYDGTGRLVSIRPGTSHACSIWTNATACNTATDGCTWSGTACTTPVQQFIYRDGLNPVGWRRSSRNPTACASNPWDIAYFIYGQNPHSPELMLYDECSDGTTNNVYRTFTDERGSVRLVLDLGTNTVAQRLDYDAFGNATVVFGTRAVQPFGFAGGIYMPDAGLWHFGARDYAPFIGGGRWTTRDPIFHAGGPNLYAYCNNDPINCTDPDGLNPVVIGFIIGGIIGGGVEAALQCEFNLANIGWAALFGAAAGAGGGVAQLLQLPLPIAMLMNAGIGGWANSATQAAQNWTGGRALGDGIGTAFAAGATGGFIGPAFGRALGNGLSGVGRAIWSRGAASGSAGAGRFGNGLINNAEVIGDTLAEGASNYIEGACTGPNC